MADLGGMVDIQVTGIGCGDEGKIQSLCDEAVSMVIGKGPLESVYGLLENQKVWYEAVSTWGEVERSVRRTVEERQEKERCPRDLGENSESKGIDTIKDLRRRLFLDMCNGR